MAYKKEEINLSETRKILMQAIMNDEFLRQIRTFADVSLLEDTYSRYILNWVFEFYDQFEQAPKQAIQSIYEKKVQYVLKESDAQIIEELLDSLSTEFVNLSNVEYYVTQAELYFNKLSIKKLQNELGRLADRGMIDEAINVIGKFRRIERHESQGVDLLLNDKVIDEAFNEKLDALFTLPGDLGDLLGSFNRGDLSAIIGPQKRGKCVTKDSFVVTANGIYKIDDLVTDYGFAEKQIKLATKDGVETTSHTYSELVNQTKLIRLSNGVEIEGTLEHPLYSLSDNKLGFEEIENIDKDDVIAMKLGTNLYGKNDNTTIASILGYLVANGSYGHPNFEFSSSNEKINNDLAMKCNKIKESSCTVHAKGVRILEKLAPELISLYGGKWGTARNKKIPQYILSATKETQEAFLASLFDCDSYLYESFQELEYSTASKDLAYGVYSMLANMGVKSDIKTSYVAKYKHTYFTVNVKVEDLDDIYKDGSVKYNNLVFERKGKERYNRSNHVPAFVWEEFIQWRDKHIHKNNGKFKLSNERFDISSNYLYSYRQRQLLTDDVAEYIYSSNLIDKNLMLYRVAEMIVKGFWFQKVCHTETKNEPVMVYDVTVPNDHSFIVNSIVSHNTWQLMEIASHAMQTGLKVWFISLEMTRNQIIRRLWQQWTDSVASEQEVTIPYFDRNHDIQERYERRKPIDTNEMTKLRRKFRQHMKTSKFQVFYYPKNVFKVSTLKTLLENSFLYKNELPDIVVIDYASIMAPEKRSDKRFELDQIWSDLSSIATEFNIHVLTASQANKATFKRDIEQGDSAEANSITAHVALMFALNQSTENKSQSCIRIANMFARHKGFTPEEQVVVLQNLACGKAMIDSRYEKKVRNLKRSKDE